MSGTGNDTRSCLRLRWTRSGTRSGAGKRRPTISLGSTSQTLAALTIIVAEHDVHSSQLIRVAAPEDLENLGQVVVVQCNGQGGDGIDEVKGVCAT